MTDEIMTRDEIENAIQEICDDLKKPGISTHERLAMHLTRKDLREQLRKMDVES